MGHANIYIRKDNEIKWEKLGDKSAWVNDMLTKAGAKELLFDRAKPQPLTEEKVEDVIKTARRIVKPPKADICKQHGIDKSLCGMMKHK